MAEDAGTPNAGNGGGNGATAQTGFQAPAEWAEADTYKPFFVEKDGAKTFDVNGLAKAYADTVAKVPVVPAKAEDYTFEFPKDFPIDEASLKLEREAAKNLELTQAQWEGMQKHALSEYARAAQEVAAKAESVKAELVKEWGPQKFDVNLARVNKAAEAFFGKDAFTNEALTNNPAVIRGLFKIAEKLTEDTLKSGSGAGASDTRPLGIDGRPIIDYSKTTPGPSR